MCKGGLAKPCHRAPRTSHRFDGVKDGPLDICERDFTVHCRVLLHTDMVTSDGGIAHARPGRGRAKSFVDRISCVKQVSDGTWTC